MSDEKIAVSSSPGLSKEQKVGFILLLIFAVISVSLGILQIRNTLYGPFALNKRVPVSVKDEVNSIDALRYRDTDNDGLNDFDELYVYGTSPYLFDTFSYGMSDKEVVAKSLPLCPKGDCASVVSPTSPTTGGGPANVLVTQPNPGTPPPDLAQALRDPAQIRQMLGAAGMDKAILNKISDAELAKMVNDILNSSSTLGNLPNLGGFSATGTRK